MKVHDRFHFIASVVMLVAILLPQSAVAPAPRAMAGESRPVELTLNAVPASQAARNSLPGSPALDDAMTLVLDDGSAEYNIGLTQGSGGPSVQFIWLNRFTPDPSVFPLSLAQIQVFFAATANSGVSPGDAIDLVVYQDADSDPTNGATLLATYHETVQATDGAAWSVYDLASPVVINDPGDVLLGVINRFVTTGITPETYPAALDEDASQARSWVGWWTTDPPDPATLPPDGTFDVIDDLGLSGNWMIRGYGASGGPGMWSLYSPVVLKNAGPPASPPVLDDISNPDGDGNYTVSWSAVSGATGYTLEEDDNAAFSTPTTVHSGSVRQNQ